MKNKGFTIIEILAVIVVLALILSIGTIGVQSVLKKMKEKSRNTKKELIISSAKEMVAENEEIFEYYLDVDATDEKECIECIELFEENNFDSLKECYINYETLYNGFSYHDSYYNRDVVISPYIDQDETIKDESCKVIISKNSNGEFNFSSDCDFE